MEKQKSNSFASLKLLGLTGLSLCALCCLLPVVGTFLGFGGLITFSNGLEKLAILFIALSGIILGIFFYRKSKHQKTCSMDCNCNPSKSN